MNPTHHGRNLSVGSLTKHARKISQTHILANDTELVDSINKIVQQATGHPSKVSVPLTMLRNTVHLQVVAKLCLERLIRLASTMIELHSVDCGQLFRHPWAGHSEYDNLLALEEVGTWYEKGWINPDVYERWKTVIHAGDYNDIQTLDKEMHKLGQIRWSLDELKYGNKRIGTSSIDLGSRINLGKCTMIFEIKHNTHAINIELQVSSH